MIAGLGRPESVLWEESFFFSLITRKHSTYLYAGHQVPPWEEPYCREEATAERGVKSGVGVLGLYAKHFPFSAFLYHRTVWALFHSILHGPREIKVKAEHPFCKERGCKLEIVRHAFPSLRDLGQVTAAVTVGLMKHGSLDCPFLSEPPPIYFWPHAHFPWA